jgi:AcrR family transcriptional regulator
MQSGSPFYHFKSKGALLYAVMEEGMRSAIERQALALQKSEHPADDPRALLAVLIRNHFDILLGPGSDFIPVMLYESRAITRASAPRWPRCRVNTRRPGCRCCRRCMKAGSCGPTSSSRAC